MEDDLVYRQKYLKYKQKYAQLMREQSGGDDVVGSVGGSVVGSVGGSAGVVDGEIQYFALKDNTSRYRVYAYTKSGKDLCKFDGTAPYFHEIKIVGKYAITKESATDRYYKMYFIDGTKFIRCFETTWQITDVLY